MRDRKLAALFVVDMGNYGRNCLPVQDAFHKLRRAANKVEFVGYHPRRSGNFVFVDDVGGSLEEVELIGQHVTGLKCLARQFADLEAIIRTVPHNARTTKGGSVEVSTPEGVRKVIYVALSSVVPAKAQKIGPVSSRVGILAWPSDRDALCLYSRPSAGGDVGQVTRSVLEHLRKQGYSSGSFGTGRSLSVIRELLNGRQLRSI